MLSPISTSLIGEILDGFAKPILPCCMVLENSVNCIIVHHLTRRTCPIRYLWNSMLPSS